MKKREWNRYSFYDHTYLTRHLEDMAQKGWLLTSFHCNGRFHYESAPPAPWRYAVVYLPKISNFDPAPGEEQQNFTALCESAGWEFVGQSFQMVIFRTADTEAVPVETEPMVQVENIHAAMKSNALIGNVCLLLMAILQVWLQLSNFRRNPLHALTSATPLALLIWGSLVVAQGVFLGSYFHYRRRALAAARNGQFLPTPNTRLQTNLLAGWLVVLLALFFLAAQQPGYLRIISAMAGLYVGSWCLATFVQSRLKKRGVSADRNRFVTIGLYLVVYLVGIAVVLSTAIRGNWTAQPHTVVETYTVDGQEYTAYGDDLPITLEALGVCSNEDFSLEGSVQGSPFLLRHEKFSHFPRNDRVIPPGIPASFNYNLYTSPFPSLLDFAEKTRVETPSVIAPTPYQPQDPAPWKAVRVWCIPWEEARFQYILRYEDAVISLLWDAADFTDAQKAVFADVFS